MDSWTLLQEEPHFLSLSFNVIEMVREVCLPEFLIRSVRLFLSQCRRITPTAPILIVSRYLPTVICMRQFEWKYVWSVQLQLSATCAQPNNAPPQLYSYSCLQLVHSYTTHPPAQPSFWTVYTTVIVHFQKKQLLHVHQFPVIFVLTSLL
jgi:hypothetical protein